MTEKQVISKKRVAEHGEVLTGKREVNAMLDLVKQETERIDSRFLEPACGTGNFLVAILERKLAVVEKRYGRSQLEFERYAVIAISSLYGIDILPDNVSQCRERLFDVFDEIYTGLFKKKTKAKCREAIWFILTQNIICGNALTLKTTGDNPQPIAFAHWSLINGKFKRMDYAFHDLSHPEPEESQGLFSKQRGVVDRDIGDKGFIPEPIKTDYRPVPYWELPHAK
jgi:SAM-dependent methyltransferase